MENNFSHKKFTVGKSTTSGNIPKTESKKGGGEISSLKSAHNEVVKEWTIKKDGGVIMKVQVESQNSYFFNEKNQEHQSMVKEPEVLTYAEVEPMLEYLEYNQKEAATFLEVDPGTISRWKRNKNEIGKLRTKNMFDVDEIVAKGIRSFGSEENFKAWLNTINYALGDIKPVELLKDPYGVAKVEEAIDALSWGTYV